MKALILAAGEGARLRSLTANRPKPMLPVGGVPLLEQIVSRLQRLGVSDIAINLHYKPWVIVHHLGYGSRWGARIHYLFEETLLGSAGAAKQLEWYFDESFIVLCGDVYTEMDLSGLIATHRQNNAQVTLAVDALSPKIACNVTEQGGEARVGCMVEEPAPDGISSWMADARIFIVEPEVLSWLPADEYLDFGQHVFPKMLAAGQCIIGYRVTDPVIDIDTPESYAEAQRLAAQRIAAQSQADLVSRIAAPTVGNVLRCFSAAHAQ